MNADQSFRQELVHFLTIRQAHMTFEDAIANFPMNDINLVPDNVGYSFWHLLEHLRLTQKDILDYIGDGPYEHLDFPTGYWPAKDAMANEPDWQNSVTQFLADRQALIDIINHPETDFYAPINRGWEGHNILREILIIGQHNAYHIGEMGALRQVVGNW